jgi:hypothetical protein
VDMGCCMCINWPDSIDAFTICFVEARSIKQIRTSPVAAPSWLLLASAHID